MSIPPIPPMPSTPPIAGINPAPGAGNATPGPGFAEALGQGLQQVSGLETTADAMIEDMATGGPTKIHEVMAATSQAGLATDLLVQVRDKAMESYHEVMRLQL